MKASDLMTGDYGITKGNDGENYIVKVVAVYNNGLINFDGVGIAGISDSLDPVPLTPENLEKNGFWTFVAGQHFLPQKDKNYVVIIAYIKNLPNSDSTMLLSIKNGYTDAKIAINYVHELQHALRLCGIEKEIEL